MELIRGPDFYYNAKSVVKLRQKIASAMEIIGSFTMVFFVISNNQEE